MKSLNFRISLFKSFQRLKFNFQPNLTEEQISSLIYFQTKKPFKVVETDKNTGSAIISNELYESLALEHLSDRIIYKELETNPLKETITKINFSLKELLETGHISLKLFNLLIINDERSVKLGSLRLLPKLHKDKFSCRPIINCKDHPTSNLSLLINLIFNI